MSSGLEIDYSIHEMLGSYKMGTAALNSKKFVEMNLQYKDALGNTKNSDFIVAEDELESMIIEMEEALAVVEKLEQAK